MRKNKLYITSKASFLCCKWIFLFIFFLLFSYAAIAQYEVAKWYKFKKAAVTYTFDDNTANQLSVALPLFDQYGFKVTFYPVINWGPNWSAYQTASNNGHEIGSHTVKHYDLDTMIVTNQVSEFQTSQNIINTNITNAKCVTIAYPSCKVGNLASIQSYFIAGRICNNNVESSTPSNFYQIGSIITGANGPVKLAADFNNKVIDAKATNGWCVFLTHALNGESGYSSTTSSELASHLAYINTNKADYWVGTFRDVVKYIKERNAVSFNETVISADSMKLVVTDNLDNSIYNVPVTVRRTLPAGWTSASVYAGNQKITSSITVDGSNSYIVFDAVPDAENIYIAKSTGSTTSIDELSNIELIKTEPNPFKHSFKVKSADNFDYSIFSLNGQLLKSESNVNPDSEIGITLSNGVYILKVQTGSKSYTTKIVKN